MPIKRQTVCCDEPTLVTLTNFTTIAYTMCAASCQRYQLMQFWSYASMAYNICESINS